MEGEHRTVGEAATRALARRLGEQLAGGELITLEGPLGAGKTVFAKGLAEGLGIDPDDVVSPTFVLHRQHQGRLRLDHVDAYRLADPEELELLGLFDAHGAGAVLLIEWASRVIDALPPAAWSITLASDDDDPEARQITIARGA